ncbi:hypothetical protein ACKF11_05385 [Methylobacillus sp. Pita2]|uniref:hypothetical protein n=1 Tax=Methylobacillus sp. Pita2 TaxID=3383245 RepID=UPI0038B51D95
MNSALLPAWPVSGESDSLDFKKGRGNIVSQIITATIEQGLVKNDPNAPDSRRYARYIPAWA